MIMNPNSSVGEDIGMEYMAPPLTIQQLIAALELMPNKDGAVRINFTVNDERFMGGVAFVWSVEPCGCGLANCENTTMTGAGVVYDNDRA